MSGNGDKSKGTSSGVMFFPTNSPKPKNIQFIVKYDKQRHQKSPFEKLETVNVWYFFFKKIIEMLIYTVHKNKKGST